MVAMKFSATCTRTRPAGTSWLGFRAIRQAVLEIHPVSTLGFVSTQLSVTMSRFNLYGLDSGIVGLADVRLTPNNLMSAWEVRIPSVSMAMEWIRYSIGNKGELEE